MYAALFSLGYLSLADRWWLRAIAIPTLVAGLFCILLSQVRTMLVILAVCAVTYLVALLLTRRFLAAVRVSVVLRWWLWSGSGGRALVAEIRWSNGSKPSPRTTPARCTGRARWVPGERVHPVPARPPLRRAASAGGG